MTVRENLTRVDRSTQRQENMRLLREKLAAGMTKDELNDLKPLIVTLGGTAEEYIEMRLGFEEIGWREVDGERKLICKPRKTRLT